LQSIAVTHATHDFVRGSQTPLLQSPSIRHSTHFPAWVSQTPLLQSSEDMHVVVHVCVLSSQIALESWQSDFWRHCTQWSVVVSQTGTLLSWQSLLMRHSTQAPLFVSHCRLAFKHWSALQPTHMPLVVSQRGVRPTH
jgi:hypothetical protein